MGKFRSKLKGQSKGKRWPKGQSSSSNPTTTKHRDLARARFFQELGPSGLTCDALRKHDAIQGMVGASTAKTPEPVAMEEASEVESVSSATTTVSSINTFASNLSGCTNMSFAKFLTVFRKDSTMHKKMLTVLTAVTKVIKDRGGTGISVDYYCCLCTTLEQMVEQKEKNEDQITAFLSLLNMVIKDIPVPILRRHFSEVPYKLLLLLNEYSSGQNNVIIKSIFGILAVYLRVQDLAVWNDSSTKQIFTAILNPFSIHSKPKWRKAAQQAAASVVAANIFVQRSKVNPPANLVAEFCEETLSTCMGGSSGTVLVSSVQAGQTTILHVLGLMKDTIRYFSKTHLKKSCEAILSLMTLNYPIVTSCGLQVLHALFSSQQAVVSATLNAQLINALYEYQPAPTDVQPTLAWLAVMQQAHVHLADVDSALAMSVLPKAVATLTQLWMAQRTEVATAATHALEILLKDALAPACVSADLVQQHHSKLLKCFNLLEQGLSYQYHNVWHQVLHTLKVMFEIGGEHCKDLFTTCLRSLAELRDTYKFSYINEVEDAVGAAIRSMGPETVLNIITLRKPNGDLNIDRSWLLPVLNEKIKGSTLKYWLDEILPMAMSCYEQSLRLAEARDGINSHSAELLYIQLWNLLHSFSNSPTDIKESFKAVAKILGMAITDRKELRMSVMKSLRRLIASAKESECEEDLQEIGRFDKNYLPILFNVYTSRPIGTDEEGQRLAALETIKVYLTIAKPELTKQLFSNALDRLDASGEPDELFVKESVLDLIRVLVPYQDAESINTLYEHSIKSLPEIKNNKEQKKAYRLLEEICGSETEGCKEFLKANRKQVQKLLMKSLDSVVMSSKGARMRCLKYLIKAQPQLDHDSKLIKCAIPEAVLCCKDINERCRAAAYELLNVIGETLLQHNQMQEFVTMLIAGFAGTTHMMCATALALASVLYHFSGTLGQQNIDFMIENVGILATSSTREIVAACLSFIKVYCRHLPSPLVTASLPVIMKALTGMTEDCTRHFRLKVRDILDRLVRKYGADSLVPHVPTTDTVMLKRLKNLRKLNARKKKQNELQKEQQEEEDGSDEEFIVHAKPRSVEEILADSDSDFEDMETDEQKPVKTRNKKKVHTYIEEDPDTIVDFTDPSALSKITTTKPGSSSSAQPLQQEKKKTKDRGFKTAPDGRLIIQDDDSDSDTDKKKKPTINFSSDSGSDDEGTSVAATLPLTDRKRKRADSFSMKSGFSGASSKAYKSGGVGIHRPLGAGVASTSSQRAPGSEYSSKKARGDVKKKGNFDPYAYLPLQRTALNKRKKAKVAGRFKNIVKAAKSGALKGTKAKRNLRK